MPGLLIASCVAALLVACLVALSRRNGIPLLYLPWTAGAMIFGALAGAIPGTFLLLLLIAAGASGGISQGAARLLAIVFAIGVPGGIAAVAALVGGPLGRGGLRALLSVLGLGVGVLGAWALVEGLPFDSSPWTLLPLFACILCTGVIGFAAPAKSR